MSGQAYKHQKYRIRCLACMSCVMCGRNKKGDVMVKCLGKIVNDGEEVTLKSMIYGKTSMPEKCAYFENMRDTRDWTWPEYINQLRRNF